MLASATDGASGQQRKLREISVTASVLVMIIADGVERVRTRGKGGVRGNLAGCAERSTARGEAGTDVHLARAFPSSISWSEQA
jgi:hypothetical protein|eukprot:COSAG01_NODE_44012_length_423_cov_1.395062_2_plen_83_part_00